MHKLKKEVILFAAFALFLIMEVGFLLPSRVKNVFILNRDIKKIKQNLINIKNDWPKKDDYLRKNEELKEEISKSHARAIFSQQESKILSFLSSKSREFGVEVESLVTADLIEYASLKLEEFKYLPVRVKIKSKFHNLARFLDYLQRSKYFFEVKEIEMVSGYPLHSIDMLICGLIKEKK
jgi:hypothetical protein